MSSLIFEKLREDSKNNNKNNSNGIFHALEEKILKEEKNIKIVEGTSLSGLNLPDNCVAMPHYFSQSSIYAPRSGDRVSVSRRTDLWSQGDMNVSYEGPALDTKIDIQLMSLVLKARDVQKSPNNLVKMKFKETMKSLGLNPHHPNSRNKFTASLNRHLEAKLYFSIGNDDAGFWRNFFVAEGTIFDYQKNILQIQISDVIPCLFKLKETGSFSIENMLISFAIKSSYSYKMYSYYESNNKPFPVKVSTLLEICDKKIELGKKPTNNHRKVIKEALDELVSLSFLNGWYFDESKDKRDPLVIVQKKNKIEIEQIDRKIRLDYIKKEI